MTEPLAGCHTLQRALYVTAKANTLTASRIHIVYHSQHCGTDPGNLSMFKRGKSKCIETILSFQVFEWTLCTILQLMTGKGNL